MSRASLLLTVGTSSLGTDHEVAHTSSGATFTFSLMNSVGQSLLTTCNPKSIKMSVANNAVLGLIQ